MINGIDIIFLTPLIVLVIIAVVVGWWQFSRHGAKGALKSVVRVIVYGGLILFALFFIWVFLYYAGGGH